MIKSIEICCWIGLAFTGLFFFAVTMVHALEKKATFEVVSSAILLMFFAGVLAFWIKALSETPL